MTEQQFFSKLVNFDHLKNKNEEEISEWAVSMWNQMNEQGFGTDPEYYPYIQLFVTYMGKYIPELNNSGRSD
jgi:hypothetical protein